MQLYDRSNVSIDLGLNIAINAIAARLFPAGYDVAEDAPNDFEALKKHVATTGRMLVWSGGSDQTIFGDPETNWAFRAWHDWHHVNRNLPFTPEGEQAVVEWQINDLLKVYGDGEQVQRWARILRCEVDGQVEYQNNHDGAFPKDQRAFTQAYLANPAAAVASTSHF